MADLVAERKIRAVGVSNFKEARMRRAHAALAKRGIPLASNQVRYSLVDRRIESDGTLAAAKELGVTIIAYSPLGQGLLSGRYHDDPKYIGKRPGPRKWLPAFRPKGLERTRPLIDGLRAIASAHGATTCQVALAWLCQFHGDTVVAIPGASRPEQAGENAGALDLNALRGRADEDRRAVAPVWLTASRRATAGAGKPERWLVLGGPLLSGKAQDLHAKRSPGCPRPRDRSRDR